MTTLHKAARPPGAPPAIWAAFASQGRWKNWVLLAQLLIILLLVLAVLRTSTRPPDVVLVGADGKSDYIPSRVASEALTRWVQEQKQLPSDLTVLHFTKDFIRLVIAVNSATIESTWPTALDLMHQDLRAKMIQEAKAQKLIETYKLARIRTEVAFDDVLVLERTPTLLHVRALVTRTKASLLDDRTAPTVDHLTLDLVERVVARSAARPDGLEVAEWRVESAQAPTPSSAAPAAAEASHGPN